MRTFLVAVLTAAPVVSSLKFRTVSDAAAAYDAWRQEFGVQRGHEEYHTRLFLFERRRDEVRKHNAQPNKRWVEAVNQFADYTPEEFNALLGHRPTERSPMVAAASLIEAGPPMELATQVDWRSQLTGTNGAKNQGSCGSCWAVAAAGAMETHAEKDGYQSGPVSFEQLVDCVQNPRQCGGEGGCRGATAELAFEYMKNHGVGLAQDYKGYQSGGDGSCRPPSQVALTLSNFVRLKENDQPQLEQAVANHGPTVVSADASNWQSYSSGIFSGCSVNATINHAILLMGYGVTAGTDDHFWLIRNSWGPGWGENGYIRLKRQKNGETLCGVDKKPLDGVACKFPKAPETMEVCGTCGILADSAYPVGVGMSAPSAPL